MEGTEDTKAQSMESVSTTFLESTPREAGGYLGKRQLPH